MRRALTGGVVAVAALAVATAPASANTNAICLAPAQQAVEVNFYNFAAGGFYERPYRVESNGAVVVDAVAAFAAPGTTIVVPVPPSTVTVYINGTLAFTGPCGEVTPTPAPVTPTPPEVTPPAGPPVITPPVRIVPPRSALPPRRAKPKPKPKITCTYLNRVKAGPRWYTKRGWYFRCKAPVGRPLPPEQIPVTG